MPAKGVVASVVCTRAAEGEDVLRGGTGPIVLQLEAGKGDQEPLAGLVRSPDGGMHEFSGWSELFAVLRTLLAPSR